MCEHFPDIDDIFVTILPAVSKLYDEKHTRVLQWARK